MTKTLNNASKSLKIAPNKASKSLKIAPKKASKSLKEDRGDQPKSIYRYTGKFDQSTGRVVYTKEKDWQAMGARTTAAKEFGNIRPANSDKTAATTATPKNSSPPTTHQKKAP